LDISPAKTLLFCDSTFLDQKAETDQAQDYEGNGITLDGKEVPISIAYKTTLKKGNIPWWAGTYTTANGYYFTPKGYGGNYCDTQINQGLTASLVLYIAGANGKPKKQTEYATMVLCPQSFDKPNTPASWTEGSNQITPGVSLQTALPKSATLLHEAFHLVHGVNFLQDGEFCKLSPSRSSSPSFLSVSFSYTCDIFYSETEC
jgi:hypothetical protein